MKQPLLGFVLGVSILNLLPSSAFAQQSGETRARIKMEEIDKQQGFQTCWAASIVSMLGYHEIKVDEKEVVAATFGRPIDVPATGHMVCLNLLRARNVAPLGQVVHPQFAPGIRWIPNPPFQPTAVEGVPFSRLLGEIEEAKEPVLMMLSNGQGKPVGHAMVLYGIDYTGSKDNPSQSTFRFLDPGKGERITMDGREVAQRLWADGAGAIFIRIAPKPAPEFENNKQLYYVTPTFDVLDWKSTLAGYLWYSKTQGSWFFYDLTNAPVCKVPLDPQVAAKAALAMTSKERAAVEEELKEITEKAATTLKKIQKRKTDIEAADLEEKASNETLVALIDKLTDAKARADRVSIASDMKEAIEEAQASGSVREKRRKELVDLEAELGNLRGKQVQLESRLSSGSK